MKRQIRRGVFETNSSSTHSIAIPNKVEQCPNYMFFEVDEFGWAFDSVNAADYFYTAIYETSATENETKEKIEKLKNILNMHGIEYEFTEPNTHIFHSDYDNINYFCLDDGYIDHGEELKDFVDELLNDSDKLIRFLSGGLVFTGNDNSGTVEWGFVNRNEEFIEDYDWNTKQIFKVKNPYHMSNHEDYEWYWKGN